MIASMLLEQPEIQLGLNLIIVGELQCIFTNTILNLS